MFLDKNMRDPVIWVDNAGTVLWDWAAGFGLNCLSAD